MHIILNINFILNPVQGLQKVLLYLEVRQTDQMSDRSVLSSVEEDQRGIIINTSILDYFHHCPASHCVTVQYCVTVRSYAAGPNLASDHGLCRVQCA